MEYAALKAWPELPRDAQERLFSAAVDDGIIANSLAQFLHDRGDVGTQRVQLGLKPLVEHATDHGHARRPLRHAPKICVAELSHPPAPVAESVDDDLHCRPSELNCIELVSDRMGRLIKRAFTREVEAIAPFTMAPVFLT